MQGMGVQESFRQISDPGTKECSGRCLLTGRCTQSLTAFAEELAKGQASYIGLYLAWRQRSAKEWEDASLAKDGDGQLSLFTSQKISEDVCQEYEITV